MAGMGLVVGATRASAGSKPVVGVATARSASVASALPGIGLSDPTSSLGAPSPRCSLTSVGSPHPLLLRRGCAATRSPDTPNATLSARLTTTLVAHCPCSDGVEGQNGQLESGQRRSGMYKRYPMPDE